MVLFSILLSDTNLIHRLLPCFSSDFVIHFQQEPGTINSSRSNSVCKEHLLLKSNSPDSCLAPAVADGVGAEEEVVAHILASHLQMADF